VTAAPHHATRTHPFTPRRLVAGGVAVLAAVAAVALLLQNTTSAACAAPPSGSAVRTGKATFYDMGGGTGNCSFATVPTNDLYVALGNAQYSAAGACGSYLDVTGPKGTVRVKVVDRCPECAAGHLDLSRTAFRKIADEVAGVVPITYKAVVNAATPGPLSVRFKDGASQWWFAVLIDNHANPLTSVQAKTSGGWRTAKRADYNYWIISGGAGAGPFTMTFTDVYGHTATATGITLRPERTQTTSVRLTGKATAPQSTVPSRKRPPSAAPTAKPTAETFTAPTATPSAATVAIVPAAPLPRSTGLPASPAAAPQVASCG
jgi:expansin (peptidoglycan-binding protein)